MAVTASLIHTNMWSTLGREETEIKLLMFTFYHTPSLHHPFYFCPIVLSLYLSLSDAHSILSVTVSQSNQLSIILELSACYFDSD